MSSPLARGLLVVHIAFGTAAVVVGLVSLLTGKGGPTHRRWGRRFLWCMVAVLGSALLLTVLAFNPYFAGLTASATFSTFSGWRVLRRKRPDRDPAQRATPLDWLVTAVAACVALLLLYLAHGGHLARNVPVVLSLAYGTLTYTTWDLWRFLRPAAWPFSPRLWLYEHIMKMVGAYFAAVAAFSGSVLLFLDPPWRQLWAVILGQLLSIAFVLRYRRPSSSRWSAPAPDTEGTSD